MACSSCVEANRELPEALARIAELGFRHVDLFVIEGMEHLHPSDLACEDGSIAAVVSAVAASGLTVSALNCGFSVPFGEEASARAQIEREFAAMLKLAVEVECSMLTMQIGGRDKAAGREEALGRLRSFLSWLAELKGGHDVRLTFEPHVGSAAEKPADALDLAQRLWPEVAVTYDPSHFAMQPELSSLAETEPLLDYTAHVHVRNAAPGRMQAPMAEGNVDFAWLVTALDRRGYDGIVAIEYLDGEEAEALALRDLLSGLGVV
ncbi:MAG: sugar phosphate isomerase/epimerase [Armatimonadota bacterium]|nr:MAG: sugar phosphate isomerase/epimerase [Armatimonadota bacterium]